MAIPSPEPGLVINYSYLWRHERDAGSDEGRKDRPSVIVLCVEEDRSGETIVTVVPITHRRPQEATAIELPETVKQHLKLDGERSWIIIDEANQFVWPGYDLRRHRGGSYAYGLLPPRFFDRVRDAFVSRYRRSRLVSRS